MPTNVSHLFSVWANGICFSFQTSSIDLTPDSSGKLTTAMLPWLTAKTVAIKYNARYTCEIHLVPLVNRKPAIWIAGTVVAEIMYSDHSTRESAPIASVFFNASTYDCVKRNDFTG